MGDEESSQRWKEVLSHVGFRSVTYGPQLAATAAAALSTSRLHLALL